MAGIEIIVKNSENKGKGLFALRDFDEGDTIFTEDPLVSCQFSWNKMYKYLACDYCMRSLETAQDMCRRLCQDESITLMHPECCEVTANNHVSCENCGTRYCSKKCKKKALLQYHPFLCDSDKNPLKDDLEKLDEMWRQMHYPPESASIMILTRMMAKISQATDKDKMVEELKLFSSRTENENEHIIHKLLGDQFKDQIEILHQKFSSFLSKECPPEWFTLKGFRSLLGLLGTNQQGIGSSSLSIWVKNCDNLEVAESERSELDTFIDNLYKKMEEHSGDFLNCEGVGLYRLQSSCNHSCEADAEICFEHGNHKVTLKALRYIPSGSEIHISYLSECDLERSRHSRQKILAGNYLFKCQCLKCERQSNDPDITSDEESDDSMES